MKKIVILSIIITLIVVGIIKNNERKSFTVVKEDTTTTAIKPITVEEIQTEEIQTEEIQTEEIQIEETLEEDIIESHYYLNIRFDNGNYRRIELDGGEPAIVYEFGQPQTKVYIEYKSGEKEIWFFDDEDGIILGTKLEYVKYWKN